MKKLTLVICVVLMCSLVMAQTKPMKRVLKPDTQITLKSMENSRNLTGGDLHRELSQYKAEKKVTNGAYQDAPRNGKRQFVVPMAPEVRNRLAAQQVHFAKTAVTAAPVAKALRMATATRSKEETLEWAYNQQWGDASKFSAYIDAQAKVYGSAETRAIHAHANAGGYVFNYEVKALESSFDMRNDGTNGSATAYAVLRVFGETKWSTTQPFIYQHVFFNGELSKSVDFFIGPVPVSVRGAIGGNAGFDAKLQVVGNGIRGTVTPGISTYGKADAGIDLWFVRAGVEGSMDLIIDYLPISLTTQLLNSNGLVLDIALKAENQLTALRGKIDVFVEVLDLWEDEWERYSMNLFSWNGIQNNWVIYDRNYQVPLN